MLRRKAPAPSWRRRPKPAPSRPPRKPRRKPPSRRAYETIGYVIKGRAELHIEGQMVLLETGDSWVVSEEAEHAYKILETFTAVEVTCPPADEARLTVTLSSASGTRLPIQLAAVFHEPDDTPKSFRLRSTVLRLWS